MILSSNVKNGTIKSGLKVKNNDATQNLAARIITSTHPPVLQQLHWLPVTLRIQCKILLITYKAIHNVALSYLPDLLHISNPTRTLRSSSSIHLSLCPLCSSHYHGGVELSALPPNYETHSALTFAILILSVSSKLDLKLICSGSLLPQSRRRVFTVYSYYCYITI